jgi:thiol-disulfide isomerase/thioredoxin
MAIVMTRMLPNANRQRPGRSFTALTVVVCALLAGVLASCAQGTATQNPAAAPAAQARNADWLAGFTGTTVDGKPFNGASLTGKPTVLWFWAPWCPTCLQQAPGVREAFQRSSGEVNFLGVAGLDTAANMPAFVQLAKLGSMTNLADPDGVVWKQFKITEQSFFVVLDASGAERYRGKLRAADIPAKIADVTT